MECCSFIHSSNRSSTALQPFVGTWPLLQFRNLFYTDGRTPWTSDQPVARPLPTHRKTPTRNKRTHRHPCLEWDSNPRSQLSSEQIQQWNDVRKYIFEVYANFVKVNFCLMYRNNMTVPWNVYLPSEPNKVYIKFAKETDHRRKLAYKY
jgi:hypothetical protein